MHIAILFFGRIKHYDKQFLLKALLTTHTYDIFYACENEPQSAMDHFVQLYKPIAIQNEAIQYDVDFGRYPNNRTAPVKIRNMTCHFINKQRVFRLFEEHQQRTQLQYDIVLATRLDLYTDPFMFHTPEPHTIYIPAGEDHTGINDRCAFGDVQTMKRYMNIYDTCLHLLEHRLSIPHPENLTLANLRFHNLQIVRFNVKQEIIR